jgi:SET domain-containing protein
MIQVPQKIYLEESPIHGLGVFAKETIMEGEIIEECPFLELPIEKGDVTSLFIDYRFNFPSFGEWEKQVLVMGYGSYYNHSENSNAYWYTDNDKRTFLFVSKRIIYPGEEICTYYGDMSYWNDGRNHIDIK